MNVNYLAMIVAALIPLIIGFLWYHPKVFGRVWMIQTGMTNESGKSMNMPVVFGMTFVAGLILSVAMNLISTHDAFIGGALFYATNKTMIPEPGSELANWLEYYNNNLAASNHTFAHGSFHGAFIGGILITLPIIIVGAFFERRNYKYIAITSGYWIISLAIMGGIIASWR
ncbi:MAG: DUF1761 domain-containing protein [Saprospiraceae bacterium]|nr:DUF1761 domain-containing protein [Saprospiraceae bacterium]